MKKRNLSDFEKASYLIVLKKILARKESKERQKRKSRREESVAQHAGQQNDNREGRVDHILAKEAGVSHDTVSKVSKTLDHATEETKQKLKEGTIIDGHHRYEICSRHKLTFKTEEREFEDEKAVMIWMIDNQMGRRNITIAAKIRLAMKKHGFLSDRAKDRQACGQGGVLLKENLPEANEKGQVRDLIGKDAGCSGKTVDKFLYIEKHDPELAEKIVKGESDKEGKRLTIDGVYNKTKTKKIREETIANLESIETQEVKGISGVYDVVVLDPPWEIAQSECCSDKAGYKPLPYRVS